MVVKDGTVLKAVQEAVLENVKVLKGSECNARVAGRCERARRYKVDSEQCGRRDCGIMSAGSRKDLVKHGDSEVLSKKRVQKVEVRREHRGTRRIRLGVRDSGRSQLSADQRQEGSGSSEREAVVVESEKDPCPWGLSQVLKGVIIGPRVTRVTMRPPCQTNYTFD